LPKTGSGYSNMHTARAHIFRLMIRVLLSTLFITFSIQGVAQTPAIDSLKKTLSVVPDTQKVHNRIRISYLYNHINADSSRAYAERAMADAKATGNKRLIALANLQLSVHFTNTSQFDQAIAKAMEAFNVLDSMNDYESASYAANILGNASAGADNNGQALKWYRASREFGYKDSNDYKVAIATFGMANIEFELKIFDSAFAHFDFCHDMFLKLGKKRESAASGLTQADIAYKRGHNKEAYDILLGMKEEVIALNDKYLLGFFYMLRGNSQRELGNYPQALSDQHTALHLFREVKGYTNISTAYEEIARTHHAMGTDDSAYYYSMLFVHLNDSLFTADKMDRIAEIETRYDMDKLLLERESEVLKRENQQFLFVAGLALMLILVIVVFWSYKNKQRDNKIIAEAKQKSDDLLLNILPEETAEELKKSGSAKARNFEMVTVMFTDFKGFTSIAEKLPAEQLVAEINEYFIEFDNIIQRHGIEKIKTIGDAYMAVGGLPTPTETHAHDVVRAALEIQAFVARKKKEKGDAAFEIRIGINSGPVIAGIVGIRKFAYDIWGDTVNIASRMESAGVAGAINASASTYALVKDQFKCIPRGRIDAKGKGELEMYFIVPEQTERVMDFVRAKEYIVGMLQSGLPVEYYYHSLGHTLDVLRATDLLIKEENITNDEQVDLLRTAAVFHDAGFLRQYAQNEAEASKMAGDMLPRFGYSPEQVAIVQRCIMVTVIGALPSDNLEKIIKDADYDYLGRDDYWDIAVMLRKEWEGIGIVKTDQEWFALQVNFLSTHEFHTETSKRLRTPMKMAHVEVLKKLLIRLQEKTS